MKDTLDLANQKNAIEQLKTCAKNRKHSIIIEGPSGSGKTFLAQQYMNMVGSSDLYIAYPKVSELRDTLDTVSDVENDVVICVENIETGVVSCSYVLLKFMEEPQNNVFIALTCMNTNDIPDTLISRSMVVTVAPPTHHDLDLYAESNYPKVYSSIKRQSIYKCASTFSDVDDICSMSSEQIDYFKKWNKLDSFYGSVYKTCWALGHYPDKSNVPIKLLIKYIMYVNKGNRHVIESCTECMNQLDKNNMASYLVIQKLVFDLRYCD